MSLVEKVEFIGIGFGSISSVTPSKNSASSSTPSSSGFSSCTIRSQSSVTSNNGRSCCCLSRSVSLRHRVQHPLATTQLGEQEFH